MPIKPKKPNSIKVQPRKGKKVTNKEKEYFIETILTLLNRPAPFINNLDLINKFNISGKTYYKLKKEAIRRLPEPNIREIENKIENMFNFLEMKVFRIINDTSNTALETTAAINTSIRLIDSKIKSLQSFMRLKLPTQQEEEKTDFNIPINMNYSGDLNKLKQIGK